MIGSEPPAVWDTLEQLTSFWPTFTMLLGKYRLELNFSSLAPANTGYSAAREDVVSLQDSISLMVLAQYAKI